MNPEEIAGYIEGDMRIDKNILYGGTQRNAVHPEKYKWPNKTVYYEFSEPIIPFLYHTQEIRRAMDNLESLSCVKFKPRTNDTLDYVSITFDEPGCFSDIGRHGGQQQMNLQMSTIGTRCFVFGTILHELLHVLGFVHQHSVPSRDCFLRVMKDNIESKYFDNFEKYSYALVSELKVPYDYESIMHYNERAFSSNGQITLFPTVFGAKIGQRVKLSEADILKLNLLYSC